MFRALSACGNSFSLFTLSVVYCMKDGNKNLWYIRVSIGMVTDLKHLTIILMHEVRHFQCVLPLKRVLKVPKFIQCFTCYIYLSFYDIGNISLAISNNRNMTKISNAIYFDLVNADKLWSYRSEENKS